MQNVALTLKEKKVIFKVAAHSSSPL